MGLLFPLWSYDNCLEIGKELGKVLEIDLNLLNWGLVKVRGSKSSTEA